MKESLNEVQKLLRKLPKQKKQEIALNILGSEAKEWFEYRKTTTPPSLIDPNTQKIVSEFKANGQKYYIRRPEEGLPLLRYERLQELATVTSFDATYGEIVTKVNGLVEKANSLVTKAPKLNELFLDIENIKQSLKKTDRNWDYSLLTCTLFIVKPDEDLTKWEQQEQEKKIEDWNEAGIPMDNFFFLVVYWAVRSHELRVNISRKAQEVAKKRSYMAT
jgi:hypothetical protein